MTVHNQNLYNYQILTGVEVYTPREITPIMSPGYHMVYTDTEVKIWLIISIF